MRLQCFDAVGWAAGWASGQKQQSGGMMYMKILNMFTLLIDCISLL